MFSLNRYIPSFVTKHKYSTIGFVIFVLLLAVYFIFRGGEETKYDFLVLERGELIQDVNVTGKVVPLNQVDLAFEDNGTISRVYVDVGDTVKRGDILAELSHFDIDAQLARAYADIETEQEKLNELVRGTRSEEIAVQEVSVEAAIVTIGGARSTFLNTLGEAYTKSDDAVRNRADQFFTTPNSAPRLNIPSQGYAYLEDDRRTIEDMLLQWKDLLSDLTIKDDLVNFSYNTETNLNVIKTFLDELAELVNRVDVGTTDTQKTSIFTARNNIETVLTKVVDDRDTLESASIALDREEKELSLQLAGSTDEELSAQQARLLSAKARAGELEAVVDKKKIRAPFDGIIARQEADAGDFVSAGTSLISVLSPQIFEIIVNVPETDIAGVSLGDKASFTLDAFGNDFLFEAEVTSIDGVVTLIEGVSTYKVELAFSDSEYGIKSGMTADVFIHTDRRENTLAIPLRAVVSRDNEKFARVLSEDGSIEERVVELGLRGSDGRIEILSGLKEGEKVITFIPDS